MMAGESRLRGTDFLLLVLVAIMAAGARAGFLWQAAAGGSANAAIAVQDLVPPAAPTGAAQDAENAGRGEVVLLIDNLFDHGWFGGPAPLAAGDEQTAHRAPGYPWAAYWLRLLPADLGSWERNLRWVQCGLGTLTACCYFLLALRGFSCRLVATLAGLLCAWHPFWIINTAEINDGVLATFLVAAALYLAQRAVDQSSALGSLLLGVSLAALALVRAAYLPFAIVAMLWFVWRCREIATGWLCALLAFLGLAIGLASWTMRNYKVFGEIVPVADSAYLHMWIGSHPGANGGPLSNRDLVSSIAQATGQDPAAVEREWAAARQTDRYARLAPLVLEQIRNDPAAAFQHRLEALGSFVTGAQWLQNRHVVRETSTAPMAQPLPYIRAAPAWLQGSLLFMLLFGLFGWRRSAHAKTLAAPVSIAVVWLTLPYVLSHAEWYHGPRLPLDGVLLTLAAFGICTLIPGVSSVLIRREAVPPIARETRDAAWG